MNHSTSHKGTPDTVVHMQDSHMQQMYLQHLQLQWAHFAAILLGFWLIASPFVLGYLDPAGFGPRVDEVTAERGLAAPELRAQLMMWSDILSGCLIIVFGTLSLNYRHRWAQWGTCFTGIWLLFAPLIFWAPHAAATNNDILVGALAIAFSILVPMMPGMGMDAMKAQEDIPPGWDYSPSSWAQRLPIVALAFFSFFLARHLMAYQLGHLSTVWDPFFGGGTERIITSDISKAWPVADAGLGAVTYLLEALSGLMGDRRRWRTMPWMVAMFGVLVIPQGGVSIYFIMIQPVLIGTWCTLCLITAAAMVLMLPYVFDEVLAMCQFMVRAKREGQSMWKVFWHGGPIEGARQDHSAPFEIAGWSLVGWIKEIRLLPTGLIVCTVLGAGLMCTRLIFGTEGAMADSDHLAGALLITISVSAFAEVVRPLRWLNFLIGAWLIAAPWLLDGAGSGMAVAAGIATGFAVIVLSIPRGPVVASYGDWDRYIR